MEYNTKEFAIMKNTSRWIIAYCPDVDCFFAIDEGGFFWECDKEFSSEESAVSYFESNIPYFLKTKNEILEKCIMGYTPENNVYFDNTEKFYNI